MPKGKTSTNQSLDRALDLLELLSTPNSSLNIAEIGKELSVSWATAQAIVNSLFSRGYLEKDPATGKYHLGYKLFGLGNLYPLQYPFLYACEKHLLAMNAKWKVKVNVIILKPRFCGIIILSQDVSLIPNMVFGQLLPAYASASGKVLLASMDQAQLDEWCEGFEFRQHTPYTITRKERLLEELETVRRQGYAMEVEELALQRACMGVPIRDVSGKIIAAVSCSSVKQTILSHKEEMLADLMAMGTAISTELGYSPLTRKE